MNLLTELQTYVRKFHATGLVWNPKVNNWTGQDTAENDAGLVIGKSEEDDF